MAATTSEDLTKGLITDTTLYSDCKNEIYDKIKEQLEREDRFQSINERKAESVFDMDLIKKISKGN